MGFVERYHPTGFDYIIDNTKRSRICFGSGVERNLIPKPEAKSNMEPMDKSIGFNDHDRSTIMNTGRMVTIGKCPRWTLEKIYQAQTYSPLVNKSVKSSHVPFNQSSPRAKKIVNLNPGPGTYNPSDVKRSMKFNNSFGGRRTIVPAVEIKCVPYNNNLCSICGIECSKQGDYWHNDNTTFLCRACMDKSCVDRYAYKKFNLKKFKPIRDCFFAHHHELFENSIKLLTARDIRKKINKEAYLCQYFPLVTDNKLI